MPKPWKACLASRPSISPLLSDEFFLNRMPLTGYEGQEGFSPRSCCAPKGRGLTTVTYRFGYLCLPALPAQKSRRRRIPLRSKEMKAGGRIGEPLAFGLLQRSEVSHRRSGPPVGEPGRFRGAPLGVEGGCHHTERRSPKTERLRLPEVNAAAGLHVPNVQASAVTR